MNRNTNFIPFALPSLGKEEEEAVIKVLRSGWLSTGEVAKQFETDFAKKVGVQFTLALNSATAGLHLGLEALKIKPNDIVVTSSYTFTATAEVIRYLGAHCMFVDIEENSFNMDPDLLYTLLKHPQSGKAGRISAVIPVHVGGQPCDMKRILEMTRVRNIPVLEDAAHAFPVKTEAGYIGTLGKAGVFSFYATKTITTGEGGMLVTNEEKLARRVSIMRLHGIDRIVWDRYQAQGSTSWKYSIIEAGFKYNMTDIAAAIGRVQLTKSEQFLARRKEIADMYCKNFAGSDYLVLPPKDECHSWHLFILRLAEKKLHITRDEFVRLLMEKGVGTSVHYIPLHIMPYYKKLYNFKPEDFPRALKKYRTCFSLPIYPALSDEQVEYIIKSVKTIAEQHYRG
ncbi:MAG: DegT/DnrJ/EryC1/StrS aminotransferase family protein [Spirochaetota bacterium]